MVLVEHLDPLTLQAEASIVLGLGVGLIRSLTGWLATAKKDGTFDKFEKQRLAVTLLKYVAGGILLGLVGVEPSQSLGAIFGIDLVGDQIKRVKA